MSGAADLPLAEALRTIEAFADLSDEDLAWLASQAEDVHFAPGDLTTVEGEPANFMVVMLAGEIAARRERGPSDGRTFIIRAGDVSGMLPFSRMTHWGATGRAVTPVRAARIPSSCFHEMLERIPVLGPRLVGVMTDRAREMTRIDQQHEKLMALGKLSAGLAHELNNPAAAARRAAAELGRRLEALPDLAAGLVSHGIVPEQIHALCDLREESSRREGEAVLPATALGPLAAAEREDEIAAWLEARGVAEPWNAAPTFAGAGMTVAELDLVASAIPAAAQPSAFAWFEGFLAAEALIEEIDHASRRISDLVGAIKAYSHMDSGSSARTETDLHRELESTLTILSHKVKAKSATVWRDYDPDLPRVEVFPGELNQVWTNLLDNALDAIAPGGRIGVRTRRDRRTGGACVEIVDDGPGIPAEIQSRIFEPFFTTKPMGEGTGLGLDVAHRIVVRRHGGELRVESHPGETRFQILLPPRAPEGQPLV